MNGKTWKQLKRKMIEDEIVRQKRKRKEREGK